jgi:hypothetical protein
MVSMAQSFFCFVSFKLIYVVTFIFNLIMIIIKQRDHSISFLILIHFDFIIIIVINIKHYYNNKQFAANLVLNYKC